jgi:hypothetical protein
MILVEAQSRPWALSRESDKAPHWVQTLVTILNAEGVALASGLWRAVAQSRVGDTMPIICRHRSIPVLHFPPDFLAVHVLLILNWIPFRDAILITVINCLTSFYGGIAIFSVMGYLATATGVPVEKVISSGKNRDYTLVSLHYALLCTISTVRRLCLRLTGDSLPLLKVPRWHCRTFGDRAFVAAAP